jgi:PAS domain S-box-containing protein
LSSDRPRPLKVLLIEDSEDDAALLVREMTRSGFDPQVRRVENERQLVAALEEGGWEAVVTDYALPGTDGRRMLRVLGERGFNGPVIAVSGSLEEEQLVQAMRAGAHDFIQKGRLARLGPALWRELDEAAERQARVSAEREIGRTEALLRGVLENMPVMLVAFGAEAEVLVWNRECERVTGYLRSQIVGRPGAIQNLFPDADERARLLAEWGRGREYREWEMSLRARDGTARVVSWSSVSATYAVPGWASWAVGLDITQRRSMEADLREANRMKDEFLATLSHELRTPLTAILGWVHLLRARRLDGAMTERAIEVIDRNAKAQAQLIADILDVSRIVTGKFRLEPRSVLVPPVLDAALDAVRPAAEAKRIRLQAHIEGSVGPIVADPDRVQQVIWNLLSNAVKFTPDGGRVDLRVRRAGARVEIVVEDSGTGIEPELLPHVFDRFRQGDSSSTRAHGGLGLGLAIVRHIVELHGGTVGVESAGRECGSRFTVAFPVCPGTTVAPPAPAAEAIEADLSGISVLAVDDDPDTLDLVATVLRQRRAEVTTVSGAEAALQRITIHAPDILLSDLAMPGMDGFELIRRARALPGGANMRAAALSAYARTEDRLRALWAGFETHIPKPVQPSELAAVVASLAGRTGRALAGAHDV